MNTNREIAYRLDPALWMQDVLGITPRPWQETVSTHTRGASILVLTARQVGKTTVAALAMAHTAIFHAWISVGGRVSRAAPKRRTDPQGQGNGAKGRCDTDSLTITTASSSPTVRACWRCLSSEESIRGLTVDAWIVADEAAFLTRSKIIAALRPMRAQRPEARLSCSQRQTPARIHFGRLGTMAIRPGCAFRLRSTSTRHCTARSISTRSAAPSGEDRYKREFLGIPAGGQVSPFTWEQFERATQAPGASEYLEGF